MKKNTFAITAAPVAISPNPNKAAINAIIKKLIDHRNIILNFIFSLIINLLILIKILCHRAT